MSETEQVASESPVDSAAKAVTKRVVGVSVNDPELVAMHKVQQVLAGLEPGQALRVIEWNKQKVLGPEIAALQMRIRAGHEAMAPEPQLLGSLEGKRATEAIARVAVAMPEFG